MKSLMKSATESFAGKSVGRFIYEVGSAGDTQPEAAPERVELQEELREINTERIAEIAINNIEWEDGLTTNVAAGPEGVFRVNSNGNLQVYIDGIGTADRYKTILKPEDLSAGVTFDDLMSHLMNSPRVTAALTANEEGDDLDGDTEEAALPVGDADALGTEPLPVGDGPVFNPDGTISRPNTVDPAAPLQAPAAPSGTIDFDAERGALDTLDGSALQTKINELGTQLGLTFTGGGTINGLLKVDNDPQGGTRRAKEQVVAELNRLEALTPEAIAREASLQAFADNEANIYRPENNEDPRGHRELADALDFYQERFGTSLTLGDLIVVDNETGAETAVPTALGHKRMVPMTHNRIIRDGVITRDWTSQNGPVYHTRTDAGSFRDDLNGMLMSGTHHVELSNEALQRLATPNEDGSEAMIKPEFAQWDAELADGFNEIEIEGYDTVSSLIAEVRAQNPEAFDRITGGATDWKDISRYLYLKSPDGSYTMPIGSNGLIRCKWSIGLSEEAATTMPTDPEVYYNGQPCGNAQLCPIITQENYRRFTTPKGDPIAPPVTVTEEEPPAEDDIRCRGPHLYNFTTGQVVDYWACDTGGDDGGDDGEGKGNGEPGGGVSF